MSELFKQFSEIKYLPVFPLPVVLLPNELLPLHIFEPRYRQMLKDIQLKDNFFGLSYFNPEASARSRPESGSFGCIAEVREAQMLEDGRSNILTIGIIRYRLESYLESDEPYLIGEISVFEDYESAGEILQPLAEEVHAMFKRVAQAAHTISGTKTALPEIPLADPQTLSFLIASAFSLPLETKYALLEMRSTIDRLEQLRRILEQAVDKMEASAAINKVAKTNGHSHNKVDLD